MAAEVDVQKTTGSAPGDGKHTGSSVNWQFYFLSADGIGSPGSNPVTVPTGAGTTGYSYECYFSLEITGAAPATQIDTMQIWTTAAGYDTGCGIYLGTTASGGFATPVGTQSTIATGSTVDWNAGNKHAIAGTLTVEGNMSEYWVMQLRTKSTASPGNMTPFGMYYSYNES